MSEEIVHAKLQEEIQKYSDVPKIMNHLRKKGSLQFLHQKLADILQTELATDPEFAASIKDSLKVILASLIDQLWGSLTSKSSCESPPKIKLSQCQPEYENPITSSLELPQPLMDKVEERRNSLKNSQVSSKHIKRASSFCGKPKVTPSISSIGNYSPNVSRNTNKTMQEKSYTKPYIEMNSFSEFNNISGHASFSRAPKEQVDREKSPGPAAYMADELKYRARSPRVCIPKAAKKELFLSESTSPSPNLYYPSKHFISRY